MKLYTIGHSNDSLDYFLGLLRRNGIDTVVDVRRIPYSRYARQFNKKALAVFLRKQGIHYVFMGDTLGGKITDPALLDGQGNMDYAKVTRSPRFLRGIAHFQEILREGTVAALLCAEKDPLKCHRFFLISRFLVGKGYDIRHIVGDKVFEHGELERKTRSSLFDRFCPSGGA